MFDNRREIMQDVFLTYLPAQRFKTSRMTVQLIAPLQRETAAANALLPAVLRRGTVRCPDMESLSAALDTLYGANIDYTVRKRVSASVWVLLLALSTTPSRPTARSCWSLCRRCLASCCWTL